jgi:hypothetical protein
MNEDNSVAFCPRCGSGHVNWRLKRTGRVGRPSERTFVWQCRGCEATWVEEIPLAADAEAFPQTTLLEMPADD